MSPRSAPVAFRAHDHTACQSQILARAEAHCRQGKLRLTPVRRRALQILLEAHRAVGAYEMLERLSADGFGTQPPVAYRALDFLVEAGCAHRVRRLNAYTACMHPGEPHDPVLLICEGCGAVAESPSAGVQTAIGAAALPLAFRVRRMNIEGTGLCPGCDPGAEQPCGTDQTAQAGPKDPDAGGDACH